MLLKKYFIKFIFIRSPAFKNKYFHYLVYRSCVSNFFFLVDFAAEIDRALRAPFEPAVEKAKSTTLNPVESIKETADLLFNVLTGRNFKGVLTFNNFH